MATKTGRNEPCPCGSGKKYKNCCIDKVNSIPGYKPILTNEDDILRYTEFAEDWDHTKGPVPSFMEFMGQANMATKALSGLTKKTGKMEFKSIEEAREYMNREMNNSNNRPVEEFLGITPAQMSSLTLNLFADNPGIVELKKCLSPDMVEGLPVLKQCLWLLNALSEKEEGVKLTAKGNLPRALVQEFYELFVKEHTSYPFKPSGEDELREIQKIRFFMSDTGLIKKLHGRMSLTKKGSTMLKNYNPVELYRLLFFYFSDVYNWRYGTGYEEQYSYIQSSKVFSLYILNKRAADFVPAGDIAGIYKKAFPALVEGIESRNSYIRFINGYFYLFLENYALFLGLVEPEGDKRKIEKEKVSFRTTVLFRELFDWKI